MGISGYPFRVKTEVRKHIAHGQRITGLNMPRAVFISQMLRRAFLDSL